MGRFLIGLGLVGMLSAIAAHYVGSAPTIATVRSAGLTPSDPMIFALFVASVGVAIYGAYVSERERSRRIADTARGPGMWDSRR
jgi:hypothetical protein